MSTQLTVDDIAELTLPPMPKKRELTEKQKLFLNYLVTPEVSGDIRMAMTFAGYSEETKEFEVVVPLIDEIKKVAGHLLSLNSIKAVQAIVKVLDDPAKPGSNVAIMAAKELLDRVGIGKKEEKSNHKIADTIVILPPKRAGETLDLTPFMPVIDQ